MWPGDGKVSQLYEVVKRQSCMHTGLKLDCHHSAGSGRVLTDIMEQYHNQCPTLNTQFE